MSLFTEQLTEAIALPAAGIPPQSVSPGGVATALVDMSEFGRVRFILYVGAFGTNANVTLQLYASKLATGASPLLITNAAITPINSGQSGPSGPGGLGNNNTIYTFEMLANQMPQGYRYVYAQVSVDVAATLLCVLVEGAPAYGKPAKQDNAAVVVQTGVLAIT